MKKTVKIYLVCIFSLLLTHSLLAGNLEERVKAKVTQFLLEQFEVSEDALEVQFMRIPRNIGSIKNYSEVNVSYQRAKIEPGYCTLWVKVLFKQKVIERFPVSVNTTIDTEVCVLNKKINRAKTITLADIDFEYQMISHDLKDLLSRTDLEKSFESCRVLKAGTILTRDMVRIAPAVRRGEKLTLKIKTGNLIITTPATAKEDGIIGQSIQIQCQPSGKKIQAVLEEPGLAIVYEETNNE